MIELLHTETLESRLIRSLQARFIEANERHKGVNLRQIMLPYSGSVEPGKKRMSVAVPKGEEPGPPPKGTILLPLTALGGCSQYDCWGRAGRFDRPEDPPRVIMVAWDGPDGKAAYDEFEQLASDSGRVYQMYLPPSVAPIGLSVTSRNLWANVLHARLREKPQVVHGDGFELIELPFFASGELWRQLLYDSLMWRNSAGYGLRDSTDHERASANIFRRRGAVWQVRFAGKADFSIPLSKGADYVCRLLASPGKDIPAVDIVCGTAMDECSRAIDVKHALDEGLDSRRHPFLDSLGDRSDWTAVEQYRDRAKELLSDIERAREENDNVRERQLENDIAMIVAAINEATGIGGKLKQAKDKRKNIRDGFRNNVKRVIEKIRETDPNLAKHLGSSIKFGNCPKYHPPQNVSWETDPVINK